MESARSKNDSTRAGRRRLLKSAAAMPLSTIAPMLASRDVLAQSSRNNTRRAHIKLSCNLYSFNRPLRDGQMSLEEVLEFCADLGFDAVDPTGYYFPGYPELPDDSYVYRIKRKAFRLGLDISGTGVRNDFTIADPARRKAEVDLVKRWVGFSARLGAPVLRVFAGHGVPPETRDKVNTWLAEALRECAEYGSRFGVMIVLQNHADFIETADHALRALADVNSEWLALNLDIGSFRNGDSYAEIAKLARHAATWQIKENLYLDGKEVKTDVRRIVNIVRDAGYRGYLPIETLGEGDPRVKVPRFLDEVRAALG